MKKIFTFFLGVLMCASLMAQNTNNEAVIKKVGDVLPVIDGEIDDAWADATKMDMERPYGTEVPTMGDAGTTYWKMLWSDAGLYILIICNDDVWYPYTGTGNAYEYDKIELYFDTNDILADGIGGQGGTTGNRQIAPDPTLTALDGTMKTQTIQGGDVMYSYKLNDPAWTTEWFIPWESIPNKDGLNFETTGTMGFDVDITDRDADTPNRQRLMWSNDATFGANNENWNNMDAAGHVTFEGAEALIVIDNITISGGTEITTDNGTVQLSAAVTPVDANQKYVWKVNSGADIVSVNKDGLVTAIKGNGTATVAAYSADLFVMSNEITITVTGQVVTIFEASLIKDGDFSKGDGTTPSSDWQGGALIEDGVMTITNPTAGVNPWDYTVGQTLHIPVELKDSAFVLRFKAWADDARIFDVDIEHGDPYTRFGTPTDTIYNHYSAGTSQWRFPLTTTPTTYILPITSFTNMDPANSQKLNLFAGMATPKVYIDSIVLVLKGDYNLTTGIKELNAENTMKVYPNPVGSGNELNVMLTSMNAKVAIFNTLGQKVMEKVATGNLVKFNVSSLQKGMYFVRLDNGITQKFIR